MASAAEASPFANRLREFIEARGLTYAALSARTTYSPGYLADLASGRRKPTKESARVVDLALGANGELVKRSADARPPAKLRQPRSSTRKASDPMRRRTLIAGIAALGVSAPLDMTEAGEHAADAFRWHDADEEPDALTLDEIEDTVSSHAAAVATTPHHTLAAAAFATWAHIEQLLQLRTSMRARRRLIHSASATAYLLGRLAFNLGQSKPARRFTTLAARHAEDIEDVILCASAAEMRSTLAFYAGRYDQAAAEAAEGIARWDDPYVRARLAAYEARARAALGDEAATRAALDRMRRHALELSPRPGLSPFGHSLAEAFMGGVLARVGLGDEGEPYARAVLDSGGGLGFEDKAHAWLSLAAALTARRHPDPEEAADAATRAIATLVDYPTSSVAAKAIEVAGSLTREHPKVPAVRDLQDRLNTLAPRALPAGSLG